MSITVTDAGNGSGMWPGASSTEPKQLTNEIWGKKIYEQASYAFPLKQFVGAPGSGKPLALNKQIGKEAGAVLTTGMLAELSGSGVTMNETLFDGSTSYGEVMVQHYLKTYLNARRNSVVLSGLMSNYAGSRYKMATHMKNLLGNWLASEWELDVYRALEGRYGVDVAADSGASGQGSADDLSLTAVPNENWYAVGETGTQVSSTVDTIAEVYAAFDALNTNTGPNALDTDALESIAAEAETLKIKKFNINEFGLGWVLMVHPKVAHDLRTDSQFQSAAHSADPRGIGNRIWQGYVGKYAGIVVISSGRVPTATISKAYWVNSTAPTNTMYNNYLLGADAVSFAMGTSVDFKTLDWDFGAQYHGAIQQIYGMSRNSFKQDEDSPTYPTDYINQSSMIITSKASDLTL